MSILFTQHWDIIAGMEQHYESFVSKTYMQQMAAMGLLPVGGYYVEAGFGPRIIAVHSAEDLTALSRSVSSREFKGLTMQVKDFVFNYRTAVLEPTGGPKQENYSIQKGVWKFNQYYDLRPGMKEKYSEFIKEWHLPTLERLSYLDITGEWNVMLGGISEIIVELTFRDPADIGRLLNNEDFRLTTLRLKSDYVANYASRILRCTERFDEPKWFKL